MSYTNYITSNVPSQYLLEWLSLESENNFKELIAIESNSIYWAGAHTGYLIDSVNLEASEEHKCLCVNIRELYVKYFAGKRGLIPSNVSKVARFESFFLYPKEEAIKKILPHVFEAPEIKEEDAMFLQPFYYEEAAPREKSRKQKGPMWEHKQSQKVYQQKMNVKFNSYKGRR